MKNPYHQLERLLMKIGLSESESLMLVKAFAFPGLSPYQLGKQCGMKRMSTYRTLENLMAKGYLTVDETKKGYRTVRTLPLYTLARRIDRRSTDLLRFASEIRDIERLLRYPVIKNTGELEVSHFYAEEAKESFYDLLYQNWNIVQALGDFDTQIKMIGMDFERPWYLRRIKQGKKAEVVFSTYGEATKELTKNDQHEMRTSVYVPNVIEGDWFNIFPEMNTTFHFRHPDPEDPKTWHVIKIVSPEMTRLYSYQVSHYLRDEASQHLGKEKL